MAGPRSNEPGMSYKKVLNLFVTTQDGEKCSVVTCPVGAFQVLLLVALTTIPKEPVREAVAKIIANLDYTGPKGVIDRWFAINELVIAGAAIPLFAPSQEPARGGPHRKTGRDVEPMGSAGCRTHDIRGIDTTESYHLALPISI